MERTGPKINYPNKMGILGWLSGGKLGLERYLYTLQRLTGVIIFLYLLLHIVVTGQRAAGKEVWEGMMQSVSGSVFRFLEFLLIVVISYHSFNGLRLILIEWFGWSIGKPKQPVYPYSTSIKAQRPILIGTMVLAFIFVVISLFGFIKTP